jgi:ribosomal protein L24
MKLKIGDEVLFLSGNFEGLTGEVISVDYNSTKKEAIYGYYHTVQLSNGEIGYVEKSEHYKIIKHGKKELS